MSVFFRLLNLFVWVLILYFLLASLWFVIEISQSKTNKSKFTSNPKIKDTVDNEVKAEPEDLSFQLLKIIDGDEIYLSGTNHPLIHVRLAGVKFPKIDDKKINQKILNLGRQIIQDFFKNKPISLKLLNQKKINHNQNIAFVIHKNKDLGLELLEAGVVEVFDKVSFAKLKEYRIAETNAKESKKGFWNNSHSI